MSEFFRLWTRANVDLENGRTADARRGFAEVLVLLNELEATSSQRERVILAKANLHARVLGDKLAARRELARVLATNPESSEALAFEARLKSEEGKPHAISDVAATPLQLLPRMEQRKEGRP